LGVLAIRRALSLSEAFTFLDNLVSRHQDYWTRRGKPGAFATPTALSFHRTLITRAFGRSGVDLLEITAGRHAIGYLYNFRESGRIYSYQSGFDYALPHRHCKPGMTCHFLAIGMYIDEGAQTYDFLAGADRYKLSLGNAANRLYWFALHPPWSISGLAASARNLIRPL